MPSLRFYLESLDRLWTWPRYLGLGEHCAWSIVRGLIFMEGLIVKMGQSMLGLFPLFGLMLNGPNFHLTTLNIHPTTIYMDKTCHHIRLVFSFYPQLRSSSILVKFAFYIFMLLYIYIERERERDREREIYIYIYIHIRKGWVCVHWFSVLDIIKIWHMSKKTTCKFHIFSNLEVFSNGYY